MELEGEIKRRAAFRKSSILVLVGSITAQVAINYVQHRVAPGWLENAIRTSTSLLGLLAVPLLVPLGCTTWVKTTREKLSNWRNGLGLSSIVLLSCAWTIDLAARLAITIRPYQSSFFNLEWLATLLYSTTIAALLAIALRGTARLLICSAALLLLSGLQSGIYF
jgi:hypothetical protein